MKKGQNLWKLYYIKGRTQEKRVNENFLKKWEKTENLEIHVNYTISRGVKDWFKKIGRKQLEEKWKKNVEKLFKLEETCTKYTISMGVHRNDD